MVRVSGFVLANHERNNEEFSRNQQHSETLTSFTIRTYRKPACKSVRIRTCEKMGEGPVKPSQFSVLLFELFTRGGLLQALQLLNIGAAFRAAQEPFGEEFAALP